MPLDSLNELRAEIERIEGYTSFIKQAADLSPRKQNNRQEKPSSSPAWSFGTFEIDQFFPSGLSSHALHEITPAHYRDSWATLSFALALLSCRARHDQKPVLWCSSSHNISEFGGLYGHGLRRFNLDPARFILIKTKNDIETSFVLEEALKSDRLCAALGLLDGLEFTPARRLSLMAAKGRTPALLMTKAGKTGIKTATTRWQIAAIPSDQQLFTTLPLHQLALPQLAWQVTLLRNRQGPADKKWHLEFPYYESPLNTGSQKAFRFTHPSPFRNRKSPSLALKTKAA